MDALEVLFERADLPMGDLPENIERAYGGSLGFPPSRLISNFVASVDGVVDDPALRNAPSVISGASEQDRFVMALLRASAGAVLIGGGTLRAEPEHRWVPAHVFPEAEEDLRKLRSGLGLPPEPELAVVTSSGEVDPSAIALREAVILTTTEGAERIRRIGIEARDLVDMGEGELEPKEIVAALRRRGHALILSEAGPKLTSQLLRDRLLDELFLTISPTILGREPANPRRGLADGVDLVASQPWADLVSVRRGGSHLFLRYVLS